MAYRAIAGFCAGVLLALGGCGSSETAGATATSDAKFIDVDLRQADLESQPGPDSRCLPDGIPRNMPIAAFGVYEGARDVALKIGDSAHATNLISITGPSFGPRRVLVLTAYEPVIWDFSHAPHDRIAGVILSGYYDQAAANLPDSIPLRLLTMRNGAHGCGMGVYAYEGGPDLDRLVAGIEGATGLKVDSFDGSYAAASVAFTDRLKIDSARPEVAAGMIRAAVTISAEEVRPGAAGIAQLKAQGAIRDATSADVAAWNEAATARLKSGRLAAFRSEYLGGRSSFAVLRAITVPADMYGAHSATFVLMPGVPNPRDRGSHNTYYSIATGTCTGASPECMSGPLSGERLSRDVRVEVESPEPPEPRRPDYATRPFRPGEPLVRPEPQYPNRR